MPRSRRGPPRPLEQEPLHDAVFERMERHHDETPTGLQQPLRRHKASFKLAKFVVDVDAQRLERARCGMPTVIAPPAEQSRHEARQLPRRGERRCRPVVDDSARDESRLSLLAIFEKNPRDVVFVGAGKVVRC